ncbi:type VI secretion system tip protein VgrG, partial [Acinetobacter sp. FNA3]|uniref:type VI secretion system Vgr family protein n=2 Tax=Acinetobacter pollinis TaxID=2605270 RepID=UPI0018C340AD
VFMNKSVLDITQILFKEWQEKSPLFASSLMLDMSGLSKAYDVRPFIMQSAVETEYEFLTRLWRSEGINWLIDESQAFVLHNKDQIQAQKLRLIDANAQFKALDRQLIRFHRSDATETFDTITSLTASRQLQPSTVHVQRWQPQYLEQEDGAGSVLSVGEQSGQYDNATLSLEDAWHLSPAWVGDLNGEDGVTPSSHQQVEALNSHLSDQNRLKSKYFTAHSTVRDAQVGYWFKLNGHPEIDLHTGSDQDFLILSKHFYNQNNLPKDIQKQAEELLTSSRWHHKNIQEDEQRQGNTLTLIRREIKVVPEYHPAQHKPTVHVQRAQVVGVEGEEIHVDSWGRIKVRFLFSRAEDNSHDGGAGSNQSDTDSAWVDVLTPWAGEGYGARFLPRVGEIVVVDFFDGNIDRPFVTGRLHEAERHPTQFDQTGPLPETKSLSGIRSQEIKGSGYNQLRFDDTHG